MRFTYKDDRLSYNDQAYNFHSRKFAIYRMLLDSMLKYDIKKEFNFSVGLYDRFSYEDDFSISVPKKYFHKGFPSPYIHSWPETGILSTEKTVKSFKDTIPSTNKIGWIGNLEVGEPPFIRMKTYEKIKDYPFLEIIDTPIVHTNNYLHIKTNWLTYQEQINRWKYIFDMEGIGWSGRLALTMWMPRVIFIQERPQVEWWFEHLKAWEHYVPIRNDCSDFIQNFHIIESDEKLQKNILENKLKFCQNYLTYDAQLDRIRTLIYNL